MRFDKRFGVLLTICAAPLTLAACGQGAESEMAEEAVAESVAIDIAEPEAVADEAGADAAPAVPGGEASVSMPQIAYRYAIGFRLPADAIKPLQTRHADMCEARGPNVCRIISMNQAESDGDYSYGNLRLAVAAKAAREFSKELEQTSGTVDGEVVSSSITGEDLSKQIVDTEARLRARTVLRDRLMETLRTRRGSVAELVEAERSVAQVNEEIDQARSWLTEMRGRVAFSQMEVSYQSGSPSSGGFVDPIRNAFGSIGAILGNMIAFLIMALAVLLPMGLVVLAGRKLWLWARKGEENTDNSEAKSASIEPETKSES